MTLFLPPRLPAHHHSLAYLVAPFIAIVAITMMLFLQAFPLRLSAQSGSRRPTFSSSAMETPCTANSSMR